jgi:hypothetical protein
LISALLKPSRLWRRNQEKASYLIQIRKPATKISFYRDLGKLRQDIISGQVAGDAECDVTPPGSDRPKSTTIKKFAQSVFKLDMLYRPVFSFLIRGIIFGCCLGIILQAAFVCSHLKQHYPQFASAFFLWILLVFGISVLLPWRWKPYCWAVSALLLIQMFRSQFPGGFFVPLIAGITLGGSLIGGSIGAIIGTLTGIIFRKRIQTAPDSQPEEMNFYLWGFVFPALVLVAYLVISFMVVVPWLQDRFS